MPTKSFARVIAAGVLGAVIGYFILHPYSAVFYSLYPLPNSLPSGNNISFPQALSQFKLFLDTFNMWYVGIPYGILGALAGVSLGLVFEARRRHEEAKRRFAMREAAHEALKELMVTLSHYLLNASTVIGGYSSLLLKKTIGTELEKGLKAIKAEAECIEAVVKSLQDIETISAEEYVPGGSSRMIDIRADLERRLAASVARETPAPVEEGRDKEPA